MTISAMAPVLPGDDVLVVRLELDGFEIALGAVEVGIAESDCVEDGDMLELELLMDGSSTPEFSIE